MFIWQHFANIAGSPKWAWQLAPENFPFRLSGLSNTHPLNLSSVIMQNLAVVCHIVQAYVGFPKKIGSPETPPSLVGDMVNVCQILSLSNDIGVHRKVPEFFLDPLFHTHRLWCTGWLPGARDTSPSLDSYYITISCCVSNGANVHYTEALEIFPASFPPLDGSLCQFGGCLSNDVNVQWKN